MNPLLKRVVGKGIYYGRRPVDMYKFSTWLFNYNRANSVHYTPATATREMIEQYLLGQKKPSPGKR